jgi:hypothetical protein
LLTPVIELAGLPPAMSAPELACYERHLGRATALLEYGAGGSTVLAAKLGVRTLYTVDTDRAWLDKVKTHAPVQAMLARGAAKLVHVDLGRVGRWGKPKNILTFPYWPRYARQPWVDGYSPDLVLIDGRFRVSCIMEALWRGEAGTKIAVHDFWTRRRLQAVLPYVDVVDRSESLAVMVRKPQWSVGRAACTMWRHLFHRG